MGLESPVQVRFDYHKYPSHPSSAFCFPFDSIICTRKNPFLIDFLLENVGTLSVNGKNSTSMKCVLSTV